MQITDSDIRLWLIQGISDPEKLDTMRKAQKILPADLFVPYALTLVNAKLTNVQKKMGLVIDTLGVDMRRFAAMQIIAKRKMTGHEAHADKKSGVVFTSGVGRPLPRQKTVHHTIDVRNRGYHVGQLGMPVPAIEQPRPAKPAAVPAPRSWAEVLDHHNTPRQPVKQPVEKPFHADVTEDFGWFAIETDHSRLSAKTRVTQENRPISTQAITLMRYLLKQYYPQTRMFIGRYAFGDKASSISYVSKALTELRTILAVKIANSENPSQPAPLTVNKFGGVFLRKKNVPAVTMDTLLQETDAKNISGLPLQNRFNPEADTEMEMFGPFPQLIMDFNAIAPKSKTSDFTPVGNAENFGWFEIETDPSRRAKRNRVKGTDYYLDSQAILLLRHLNGQDKIQTREDIRLALWPDLKKEVGVSTVTTSYRELVNVFDALKIRTSQKKNPIVSITGQGLYMVKFVPGQAGPTNPAP